MRPLTLLCLGSIALASACDGATGPAGARGEDGAPCAVTDNNDGTKTIACPGSPSVTIANGKAGTDGKEGNAGTSCTVKDNGDGTSTISCTDDTEVIDKNGAPCTAVDNNDGTKTITCPDSPPVVVNKSSNYFFQFDPDNALATTDGTQTAPGADPPMVNPKLSNTR